MKLNTHLPKNSISTTIMNGNDVSLSVTPVDGELLSIAKHEIKALCRDARDVLNKPSNEELSKSECINYFLDSISGPLFHRLMVMNWKHSSES